MPGCIEEKEINTIQVLMIIIQMVIEIIHILMDTEILSLELIKIVEFHLYTKIEILMKDSVEIENLEIQDIKPSNMEVIIEDQELRTIIMTELMVHMQVQRIFMVVPRQAIHTHINLTITTERSYIMLSIGQTMIIDLIKLKLYK